jgi:SAM-dependent methyltransferase
MILPDGWLSPEEAGELQRLAKGKTVLELGAWKGRSTVVLAGVARFVVSVDRHQGIEEVGGADSLPDYLQAVRELENVAIVVADFQEFLPLLGVVFDLVFVDGDHDADSVERDVMLACQHVYYSTGIIALHDWDFDSVREGANRVLGNRYTAPESLVGSIASFTVA